MDEIADHLRPEGSMTPRRIRTTSLASPHFHTFPRSEFRSATPRLRHRTSTRSVRSTAESDAGPAEIVSPIPRRHLLQTSESKHWLNTPPLSPASSRATSPTSVAFSTGSHSLHRRIHHHLSFSSLLEKDEGIRSIVAREKRRAEKEKAEREREGEGSMGKRWVRWMHKNGMKPLVVPGAIGASIWVKWCIGLGSYSGQGTPPMYGDYEAHRHWMELTIHLPLREWYTYDLQYWGLDYPPLIAYVSWVYGHIGLLVNPSWFALVSSRGVESPSSKVFMRSTVLVLDTLVYVPALLMFVKTWQESRSKRTQNLALLVLLFQPALLLVDFGHFQLNSAMLGFTLLAVNFFAKGHDVLGAFCFVLSLGFKQMALYYAPAIGAYLMAKCIYLGPTRGSRRFIRLALTTLLTFLMIFLPFLPPFTPPSTILGPITRIFPFNRGLFEDKVANFWCASDVLFKWKTRASRGMLVKLSAGLTATGFLSSVVTLIQSGNTMRSKIQNKSVPTPMLPLLPYALLTSSLSFFLFSFQVHEKTILLPLLPATLLLSGAAIDSNVYGWGALLNNVGVFSMWPLLKRDGLSIQYIATMILWNRLIGYNPFRLNEKSFIRLLSILVYLFCIFLHVLELVLPPPPRYPDLFSVLNVLISTPVFVLAWLWSVKCGIEVSWALGGLGAKEKQVKTSRRQPVTGSEVIGGANGGLRTRAVAGLREGSGRAVSLGPGIKTRRSVRAGSIGASFTGERR